MHRIEFLKTEDKDRYYVTIGDKVSGEVFMQQYGNYVALSHIDIYKEYRGYGYGKLIVGAILDMPRVDAIVGESLKTSTKFWNSCISTYGGYTTKQGRLFANTAFAFVVGTDEELDTDLFNKLLQMSAEH